MNSMPGNTVSLRSGGNGFPSSFLFRSLSNVFECAQVVMVCYRDGIQAFLAARGDEVLCVLKALGLGNGPCTFPVKVARRMHLKITSVKMSALVHPYSLLTEEEPYTRAQVLWIIQFTLPKNERCQPAS